LSTSSRLVAPTIHPLPETLFNQSKSAHSTFYGYTSGHAWRAWYSVALLNPVGAGAAVVATGDVTVAPSLESLAMHIPIVELTACPLILGC